MKPLLAWGDGRWDLSVAVPSWAAYIEPMRKFLFIVLLLSGFGAAAPLHAAAFVFSGVVLDQGDNPLLDRFASWISKHGGGEWRPNYQASYRGLSDYMRAHPTSLGWTCGAPYVEDAADGQQLVAVPLFHGEPTYHSLVMTRAGRSEKALGDFKGGVFAYSDPRSNSGYLVPAFELRQQGIDIHTHFSYLLHTGLHENTIQALLAGLADVGNVDEYVWVEYLNRHPEAQSKLKVIERFGPFPFTPIVAAKAVPQTVIEKLQQALVDMRDDPEGRRILDAFGLDGFVVKTPRFYAPIEAMQQALSGAGQ